MNAVANPQYHRKETIETNPVPESLVTKFWKRMAAKHCP